MDDVRVDRRQVVRHLEAIRLVPNDETKDPRNSRRASLLLQERDCHDATPDVRLLESRMAKEAADDGTETLKVLLVAADVRIAREESSFVLPRRPSKVRGRSSGDRPSGATSELQKGNRQRLRLHRGAKRGQAAYLLSELAQSVLSRERVSLVDE